MHIENKKITLAWHFHTIQLCNSRRKEILMNRILRENVGQKFHYNPSASISTSDTTEHIPTLKQ